ncbi:MAG: efflux RND transporter periplasmic adaptor subunit [Calditrichaceae bacterium]|nr:efflux RND transporter periplasmic adaptor subunit [Calditrichaceae bacterium]
MKTKTKTMIAILVVLILVWGSWFIFSDKDSDKTTYEFAEITKGNIENIVSATGTIEPVMTVEVGTQVSGIINKIYVDFNDKVKKNQLLAVIDTTILSIQVRDAEASLLRAQAQYNQENYNYEKTKKLFERKLVSEYEVITSKSSYQSAKSALLSAKNSLERAERNMRYAYIRSPINGTVIHREIEEGQTVTSSFQTPRLFLIAEDLSKMEIHALVDESEIGSIEVNQSVRFEVPSHDEKVFNGKVRQIWLQPETVQNVVNYTVVVDADNTESLLLPGMTATLDFVVEDKKNVLLVPVSATRIEPTKSMLESMFAKMRERFGGNNPSGASAPQGFPAGGGTNQNTSGTGMAMMEPPKDLIMLWFFNEEKEIESIPVKTGSTDGKNIEITPLFGAKIEVGKKIISSIETTEPTGMQTMTRPRGFGRPF